MDLAAYDGALARITWELQAAVRRSLRSDLGLRPLGSIAIFSGGRDARSTGFASSEFADSTSAVGSSRFLRLFIASIAS